MHSFSKVCLVYDLCLKYFYTLGYPGIKPDGFGCTRVDTGVHLQSVYLH